jgi:hypothetical protein
LSFAVAEKLTTAEHCPVAVDVEMLEGQLTVGACVSLIVTVKLQDRLFPLASLTVQLTVVVPLGKVEPDDGLQVTAPTPSQLSVALGVV